MKKFLNLVLLVGCFTLFAATTVSAQDAVRNNTACTFLVKVGHGAIGSCTATGFITALVPPFTQINLGVPATDEIIISKGIYNATPGACPYYIGLAGCGTPYPQTVTVPCLAGCGTFTADLIPGFGIHLF